MIWMMGQSAKPDDDTKPERVADTPEGHATFQRDLNRLEKWTGRILNELQKSKVQSPVPGEKQPQVSGWAVGQPTGKTQS